MTDLYKKDKKKKIALYILAFLVVIGLIYGLTMLFNSINEEKSDFEYTLPTLEQDQDVQKELYEEVKGYEGRWTGTWTNTTFNTEGTIVVDVTVQPEGIITAEYDLEGRVFGWVNPERRLVEGVYTRDGVFFIVTSDYVFGSVRVHLKPDYTISISGLRIPLTRVNAVTATGAFDEQEAIIDYNVNFFGGNGGSKGVVELKKEVTEEEQATFEEIIEETPQESN